MSYRSATLFLAFALPIAAVHASSRTNVWTYYKSGTAYGIRKGGWTIPIDAAITDGLLTVIKDNVYIKLTGSGDLDLWDVAVDMGNGTTNDITAITFTSARFYYVTPNTGIKSIRMNNIVTINFERFFYQCKGMTKVELDYHPTLFDGVIPAYCFQNDSALAITPDVVIKPSVISIGNSAFNQCKSMYGELNTLNVRTIGDSAFRGDNNNQPQLTAVEFGPKLTSIGQYAFRNVKTIGRVHFQGRQTPTMAKNAFEATTPSSVIFDGLPPADTTASLDNLSVSYANRTTTHPTTFYASKKLGDGAWAALASPLISSEAPYAPAGNFGVYLRGTARVAWFVARKSPYEVKGLQILVR